MVLRHPFLFFLSKDKHGKDVFLYGCNRTLKLARNTYNFIVFHNSFAHEVLAVGEGPFVEVIHPIAYPLRPILWLEDFAVNGEQMLNLLEIT